MLFSIIIPVYNAGDNLIGTLNSVLQQKEKDFEILVIDDASTDDTMEMCLSINEDNDNIKIYKNKENKGVAYTRNVGIKKANGEYVIFLDSDDVLEDDILGKIKNACFNRPDCIKFGYDEVIVQCDGKFKSVKKCVPQSAVYSEISKAWMLIFDYFGYVWASAYRREFLLNNNIYFNENKRIDEDTEFNTFVFKNMKKLQCIDCIGYHYVRQNDNSLSNQNNFVSYESLMEKFSLYRDMAIYTNVQSKKYDKYLYWMYARFICSYFLRLKPSYDKLCDSMKKISESKFYREFKCVSFKGQPLKRRLITHILKSGNTIPLYCVIYVAFFIKKYLRKLFLYVKN